MKKIMILSLLTLFLNSCNTKIVASYYVEFENRQFDAMESVE